MLTKETVTEALKTIKDPEVGYDIVTMGLIYNIDISGKDVKILMTYTTPFCPWGPQINDEVTTVLKDSLGAKNVDIEITFDPPYKMPEELRISLGL